LGLNGFDVFLGDARLPSESNDVDDHVPRP
jgi:hypothetical protein